MVAGRVPRSVFKLLPLSSVYTLLLLSLFLTQTEKRTNKRSQSKDLHYAELLNVCSSVSKTSTLRFCLSDALVETVVKHRTVTDVCQS